MSSEIPPYRQRGGAVTIRELTAGLIWPELFRVLGLSVHPARVLMGTLTALVLFGGAWLIQRASDSAGFAALNIIWPTGGPMAVQERFDHIGARWIYSGDTLASAYRLNGEIVHPKTCHSRWGKGGQSIPWLRENIDPQAERIMNPPKHKYLYPLDKKMRRQIEPLAKPYPKRASGQGDTSATSRAGRFDSDPDAPSANEATK